MQDMLAQLAINDIVLFSVQSSSISVEYVFKKRAHIVQIFFDSLLFVNCDENLDQRIFIVDDLISLCTRQERRSRKSHQSWKNNIVTSFLNDSTDMNIKSKCSNFNVSIECQFSLQCRSFQCLHCIDDVTLPSLERQHVFDSKHSLQRHFDRHHEFQSSQNCSFLNDECVQLALESLMHFKNHAAKVHEIYMSDKC